MENKLQALTDKLYQDGLSKGKEEGERLLQDAKAQASRIVESAQEQAKESQHAIQKQKFKTERILPERLAKPDDNEAQHRRNDHDPRHEPVPDLPPGANPGSK